MSIRRAILALALIGLAGVMAWVGLLPEGANARLNPLLFAALPLIAAGVLFMWRAIGSLLALPAGAVGFVIGAGLSVGAGFGGNPVHPAVNVLVYLGLAVVAFAVIDLVALLLSRRSAPG